MVTRISERFQWNNKLFIICFSFLLFIYQFFAYSETDNSSLHFMFTSKYSGSKLKIEFAVTTPDNQFTSDLISFSGIANNIATFNLLDGEYNILLHNHSSNECKINGILSAIVVSEGKLRTLGSKFIKVVLDPYATLQYSFDQNTGFTLEDNPVRLGWNPFDWD